MLNVLPKTFEAYDHIIRLHWYYIIITVFETYSKRQSQNWFVFTFWWCLVFRCEKGEGSWTPFFTSLLVNMSIKTSKGTSPKSQPLLRYQAGESSNKCVYICMYMWIGITNERPNTIYTPTQKYGRIYSHNTDQVGNMDSLL